MEREPVQQTHRGVEPRLPANSNKKRGNFTKRKENQRQSKKKHSIDDRTNYDDLLGNRESHRGTRLQLLLAAPVNRGVRLGKTVNVTMNIFHKPVKLEGGRVD